MKNYLLMAVLLTSCAEVKYNKIPVDGKDGHNGDSCVINQMANGAIITCGSSSAIIMNGLNGLDGTDGENGTNGLNGTNGTNGHDGANGLNGVDAPHSIGIAGYIYPCGNEFANDEMFLRLTDGSIIAVYDGGNYLSRLVKLAPGSYITTDRGGAQCYVAVDANLNVVTSPIAATGLATNTFLPH